MTEEQARKNVRQAIYAWLCVYTGRTEDKWAQVADHMINTIAVAVGQKKV